MVLPTYASFGDAEFHESLEDATVILWTKEPTNIESVNIVLRDRGSVGRSKQSSSSTSSLQPPAALFQNLNGSTFNTSI